MDSSSSTLYTSTVHSHPARTSPVAVSRSNSSSVVTANSVNNSSMRIPKLRKAHSALALKPDSRQQYTNTQHAIIGSQAAALASPTSILDAYGRPSIDSIALAAGKRDYTERESFEDDDDTAFSQVHASELTYDEDATIRFPMASTSNLSSQQPPNTSKRLPKPPRPVRIRPLSDAVSNASSTSIHNLPQSCNSDNNNGKQNIEHSPFPPSSRETVMPTHPEYPSSFDVERNTSTASQLFPSSFSSSSHYPSRPDSLVVNDHSCSASSIPSPVIDVSSASSAASSYFIPTPGLHEGRPSSENTYNSIHASPSKSGQDEDHLLGRSLSQRANEQRSRSLLRTGSNEEVSHNARASVYTTHTSASDWARERETEMRNSKSGVFDLEYDLHDQRSGSSHDGHDSSNARPVSIHSNLVLDGQTRNPKDNSNEHLEDEEFEVANQSAVSNASTSGFVAVSVPASPASPAKLQTRLRNGQQRQESGKDSLTLPPETPTSPTSPNSAGFGLGITSDDAIHPIGVSLPPSTTGSPDSLSFNEAQLPDQHSETFSTSVTSAPKSRWSTTRAYIRRNTASSARSLRHQQSKSSLLDARSPSFPSLQHSSSCTSLSEQYNQQARYDDSTSTGYTSESDKAIDASSLSQFTHPQQSAAHPNSNPIGNLSNLSYSDFGASPRNDSRSVYTSNANSYLSTESAMGDHMEEVISHGDDPKATYEALRRGELERNKLSVGSGSTRPTSQAVAMAESGKGRVTKVEPWQNIEDLSISSETTHLMFSGVSQPVSLSNILSNSLPGLADKLLVLDVSNCSLSTIPQAIFLCSNLEELNMSGNLQVSGTLPPFISSLVSLRVLLADSCGLSSVSHSFANLRHIHTLAMRNNNLKYLPAWLSRLSDSLELLLLDDNPFHGDYADLVKSCSQAPVTETASPQRSSNPITEASEDADASFASNTSARGDSLESQEQSDTLGIAKIPTTVKSPRTSLLSRTSSMRLALGRSISAVEGQIPSQSSSPVQSLLLADSSSQASTARRRGSILKPMKSMGDLSAAQLSIHELVSCYEQPAPSKFTMPSPFPISPAFSDTSTMDSDPSSARPSPNLVQGQPSFRKSIAGSFAARRSRKSSRGMTALEFIAAEVGEARNSQLPSNFPDAVSSGPVSPNPSSSDDKSKDNKPGFFRKLSMGVTRRRKSNAMLNSDLHTPPMPSSPAPPLPPPTEQGKLGLGRPPFLNSGSVRSNSAPDTVGVRRPYSTRETMPEALPPMPRSVTGLPESPSGTWKSSIQSNFLENSRRYRKKSRPPIPEPLLELAKQEEDSKPTRRRSYLMLNTVLPPVISPGPLALHFDPMHAEDQTIHARPQLQTLTEERSPTTEQSLSQQATAVPSATNSPVSNNWSVEARRAALAPLLAYLRDLDDLSRVSDTKHAENTSYMTRRTDSSRLPQRKTSSAAVSVVSSLQPDRSSGYESRKADSTGVSSPANVQGPISKLKDDPLRRKRVITEIIATEKSYIASLQELVTLYIAPASAPFREGSRETVVPQSERVLIFSVIESITQFHFTVFLPALEQVAMTLDLSEPDAVSELELANLRQTAVDVARVFTEHAAFMKLYHSYTVNFDTSLDRVALWESFKSTSNTVSTPPLSSGSGQRTGILLTPNQRKRIRHLMKTARKDPRHNQLALGGYLLMPIQRIPRYKMMLENLLECTPLADSPDQAEPLIAEALASMSNLATEMNERKRDNEGRQRLLYWQAQLSRFKSPLVQPHRTVLREGHMLLERVVKRDNAVIATLTASTNTEEGGPSSLIQIPVLKVDRTRRRLIYVLCNDILILILDTEGNPSSSVKYETFTVLRLGKSLGGRDQPASTFGRPDRLRIVEDRAVLYLFCPDAESAQTCRDLINRQSLQTGLNYRFLRDQN